jgi:hypothetical protein
VQIEYVLSTAALLVHTFHMYVCLYQFAKGDVEKGTKALLVICLEVQKDMSKESHTALF